MANDDKDKRQAVPVPAAAAAGAPAARGGRVAVSGVVVAPDAAGVTVTPKDQPEADERTVKGDAARALDQVAQKMAGGHGQNFEQRSQLAAEVEGIAQKAKDAGHPVSQLDGLVDKLNDQKIGEYQPDERSDAHAQLVAEIAKARDEINESLGPKEDRQPKSQR